jgi:hypothetical protein
MFDMDEEQKRELINEIQRKLSIVNFKYRCIKSNFQNMQKKYSVDHYCNYWPNMQNLTMTEIINLERHYNDDYKHLKKVASKKEINLFEDQDIKYFIQYYNVTFIEENKPFLIEI